MYTLRYTLPLLRNYCVYIDTHTDTQLGKSINISLEIFVMYVFDYFVENGKIENKL